MPDPGLLHPEPLPCGSPLLTRTSTGDTQNSSGSVSVGSLGPSAQKLCLSPLSFSCGEGFDSKRDFASPTFLLGLPLCPWMWGISLKSLQHQAANQDHPQEKEMQKHKMVV